MGCRLTKKYITAGLSKKQFMNWVILWGLLNIVLTGSVSCIPPTHFRLPYQKGRGVQ